VASASQKVANDPKRTGGPDVTYTERKRVMAGVKVTCVCGAIYEVIETKGPSERGLSASCATGIIRMGW
jgi:hypothetical protein